MNLNYTTSVSKTIKYKLSNIKSINKMDVPENENAEEIETKTYPNLNIKTICILVNGLEKIVPSFSMTDLVMKAKYKDTEFEDSDRFPWTNDKIIKFNYEIHLTLDVFNLKEINDLLNNPIYFTLYESLGTLDYSNYPPPRQFDKAECIKKWSTKSAIGLVEAISGEQIDRTVFGSFFSNDSFGENKNQKKVSSNTLNKKRSLSATRLLTKSKIFNINDSKTSSKRSSSSQEGNYALKIIGSCSLDLMVILTGKRLMLKRIPIYQHKRYYDERLVPEEKLPKMNVTILIPKQLFLPEEIQRSNILFFTLESMYNLPKAIGPDYKYYAAAYLPINENLEYESLAPGVHKEMQDYEKRKKWPNLTNIDNLSSFTKYKIDNNINQINPKFTYIDLEHTLTTNMPRIEWNTLNRKYLLPQSINLLQQQLTEHRFWPIEFYFSSKEMSNSKHSLADSKNSLKTKKNASKLKSTKDSTKSGTDIGSTRTSFDDYSKSINIHMIAFIDLSSLLQPGVKKTRVLCQLHSFQYGDAKKFSGSEKSYFLGPPPVQKEIIVDLPNNQTKSKSTSKSKSKSNSKKDSSKASKSSKKSKSGDKDATPVGPNNLNQFLPFHPRIEPLSSEPLFDDNGIPLVVLVEVELLCALKPKIELQNFQTDLLNMIVDYPSKLKLVEYGEVADMCFKNVTRNLVKHMYDEYLKFEDEHRNTLFKTITEKQNRFLEFLNGNGFYQIYLATMQNAAGRLTKDRFSCEKKVDPYSTEYQDFIGKVYVGIVREMNKIISDITVCGLEKPTLLELDSEFYYAREMMELGADDLAKKYYLERIARDESNAQRWFEYAIFLLEIGDNESAFECVSETLDRDYKHKYALLIKCFMLANKFEWDEAEKMFLELLAIHSRWAEGWACLYLMYQHRNKKDTCNLDVCRKMLYSCENDSTVPDTVIGIDELSWTSEMAPKTIFYRTAILLLKLRILNYAEKALAMECLLKGKEGIWHYYMGVLLYINQDYSHALEHLYTAEGLQGNNHAIGSLIGHCLIRSDCPKEAKEYYKFVLTLYNRPKDLHLLYLYLSIIYESDKELYEAKDALLNVCKMSPTPYSWLSLGIIYMQYSDCLSAEECFVQANLLDFHLAEPWAYLAIINAIMDRADDATYCQKKACECNLNDSQLKKDMEYCLKHFK